MTVRTRFAPSPTGYLHIGSLRTALYAYAFAKSQNGVFVLRIEDTDRNRFVPGSTEKIYDQLKLFGINWDEGPIVGGPFGPYIQSERVNSGIYKKYAEKLVTDGHAFYCFCQPVTKEEIKEARQNKVSKVRDLNCRNLTPTEVEKKIAAGEKPAIRLKVPDNEVVSFYDFVVKKQISWKTENVDEAMLLKSDGMPTYQLGVVVDDVSMEMTHIIRALEWLPSTPIHLLLFNYLGFKTPQIGHLTDILDPLGGKLSKRKGNVSTEDFIKAGYLPEAILNFIMLVGWAPKDNRELFTLGQFVEAFDSKGFQKTNPIFNREKLDWFNGEYIRQKSDPELTELFLPFAPDENKELIAKITPLVKNRIAKLSDFRSLAGFFFEAKEVDKSLLGKNCKDHIEKAIEAIENGVDLMETVEKNKFKTGDFFMDLRIAVSGSKITPPLTDSIAILGKQETLARLKRVID